MTPSYPDHLLDQAEALVAADPRRPRQANLRRAVSAAYYALFPFLVDRAGRAAVGGSPSREALRDIVARGFEHGAMKEASKSFAGGTLPRWMRTAAPRLAISPDLQSVADAFVLLQEQRRRADYRLTDPLTRREAARLVAESRAAIDRWPAVAEEDAARLYLAGLLCWKTLRQR